MHSQKTEHKPKNSRVGERRSSSKHRVSQKHTIEKPKNNPTAQSTNISGSDKRISLDAYPLPKQRISSEQKIAESSKIVKKSPEYSHNTDFEPNTLSNSMKPSPKMAASELPASVAIRDHYGQDWKNTPFDDFQRILAVDYEPEPAPEIDSVDVNMDPDLHSKKISKVTEATKRRTDDPADKKQERKEQEPALGGLNNRAFLSSKSIMGDAALSGDPGSFIVYASCNCSINKETQADHKSLNQPGSDFGIKWDFSNTKVHKQSKRARDLLRIIELGFSEYRELIEIPPLEEYLSYMLKFGQRDHNQVQTQTNEDLMQRETQTDLLGPNSFVTSWTQSPPDDEGAYAGHECDKPVAMQAATGDEDDALEHIFNSIVSESFPDLAIRSQSGDGLQVDGLSSLPTSTYRRLCDSLNMVLTLLEEAAEADRTGHVAGQHQSNPNSEAPSAVGVVQGSLGHLSLSLAPSAAAAAAATNPLASVEKTTKQFNGRRSNFFIPDHCYRDMSDLECVRCEFTKASSRRLLTMHRLKTTKVSFADAPEHSLYPCDMICVWAISDASGQGRVERILKCPGLLPMSGRAVENNLAHEDLLGKGDGVLCVTAECMRGYDVVIGGLSDGSLALWDLASAFSPSFDHEFTRKFQLHCYPEKATATKSTTDVAVATALPSIFDYAQPPDYLASCVFAAGDTSSSSSFAQPNHKPSRGGKAAANRVSTEESRKQLQQQYQQQPSPIISIQVLRTASTPTSSQRDRPLTSFQLCTLDARGQLVIWLVVTCSGSQTLRPSGAEWGGSSDLAQLAGSVTDFGLRPGGSIRIVQLASISAEGVGEPLLHRFPQAQAGYEDYSITTTRDADATSVACWNVCPFTTCLEVCHSTDMFFVGSEDGKIWQRCRVSGRPVYPAFFHLHPETALSVPSPHVTCIALHPTFQDLLLAGYADGHLALYLTHRQSPIFTWRATAGQTKAGVAEGPADATDAEAGGVKKVIWSNHRPTVFYCLTSTGEVAAWILFWRLKQCFNPHAQTLIAAKPSNGDGGGDDHRVVDFTMVDAVGTGCLALCWSDGAEVHWLEDHLTVLQADELLLLQNVLNQLA